MNYSKIRFATITQTTQDAQGAQDAPQSDPYGWIRETKADATQASWTRLEGHRGGQ